MLVGGERLGSIFGPGPESLINRIGNVHFESDKAFGPLALTGLCLPRSSSR